MRYQCIVAIREAVKEDAFSLARIHHHSRAHAYQGIVPLDVINSISLSEREQYWINHMDQAVAGEKEFYVAEHEGKPVGFIMLICRSGQGEVDRVYVLPDRIGSGIGKALMTFGLERLRALQCGVVKLWVLEGNAVARKFYESAGFEVDGRTRALTPFPKEVGYTLTL